MKPLPAPNVPGNTEAERMDNAIRKMFTVSKEDVLKAEREWRQDRAKKKAKRKLSQSKLGLAKLACRSET